MKPKTFSELYRDAEEHEDYWTAGAILEFTESVVREMERQGVTRTELAERLGTTPAYVTKILRGRVNFTLATMVRLARALGSELHVRLGGSQGETMADVGDSLPSPAGRPGKVATAATRPAALRTQPTSHRKSPARSAARTPAR